MCRTGVLYSIILALGILAPCPPAGHPFEITPFRTQNQSPVIQIYGLPAVGDSRVLLAGDKELTLVFDLANHFVDDSARNERILFDGETYRLNLAGRVGVGNRFEVGFELPYIFQNGGFLDGFIDDYHRTFGLSRGGRDRAPNGRLLFDYQRNGADLFRVNRSNSGLGDLRLTAGFQLQGDNSENHRALALRASLKVPTGDSDELHGSGSADLALWLSGSQGFQTGIGMWEIFGGGGALGMTEGNVLPERQRHVVAFGSLGAGWQPLSWLTLKVQFDGHTAFYEGSQLVELDSNSVQVIMGGTLTFSERTSFDIGVSEDLVVKTAPDVVFHFALSQRF